MQGILFKVIFRGWMKNRIHFLIAVMSLIVGLTCSVLLIGFVMNEYRIAGSVPDSEQIFLLQAKDRMYQAGDVKSNSSDPAIALELKDSYPEVKSICLFHNEYGEIRLNERLEHILFYSVTSNFADFFHPRVLAGNIGQTLASPAEVAITKSYALRLFGRPDPIGESVELSYTKLVAEVGRSTATTVKEICVVTTILDDSADGFLTYGLLRGFQSEDLNVKNGHMGSYNNFVKLDKTTDPEKFMLKVSLDTVFKSKFYEVPQMSFIPMRDVYFADEANTNINHSLIKTRDKALLYIGLSIALAVLLIACFNYVNISMTRMLQRMRVTGQQLVLGATRGGMQGALIIETGMQVIFAFFVAVGVLYLVLPQFNGFMNSQLTLGDFFQGEIFWIMILLLVVVTVLPSLYIFSKLENAPLGDILKQACRQRSELITGMVVAQFVVSVVLMITMLNIRQQMEFIAHVRPDADRIFSLGVNQETAQWQAFRDKLSEIPEIEQISSSSPLISNKMRSDGKLLTFISGERNIFDFYKMELISGSIPEMGNPERKNVVVNETMVKMFDIKEPLGYEFLLGQKYRICGVVRDFPVDNLTKTIEPMAIMLQKDPRSICLKIPEASEKTALAKVRALWREVEPLNIPLECKSMAQLYRELHANDQRLLQVVWVFAWISLLLTSLGLFGLAWFSVERRKREIGIRKINGATEVQVVTLLCGRFIKWIGWAFVIAIPVALWLIRQWMEQFVYRTDIAWWTFAGVGLFVIIVGVATVIWQSWRVAVVNPVEVVKTE